MNLTEGQLFTIEALNRIEGFVWPDLANYASPDNTGVIHFYTSDPSNGYGRYISSVHVLESAVHKLVAITREQFDSVNGWVRNDGNKPVISGDFDLLLDDGEEVYFSDISDDRWDWSVPCKDGIAITHWRYHKPTKESEMQNPKPYKKRERIETLIDKRKDAIEQKRLALAALEEAEAKERELMLSIQAWAESYGFDIRMLDESDEVPDVEPKPVHELVITDWRDLRVGDVIWWSGDSHNEASEYEVCKLEPPSYTRTAPICLKTGHDNHAWVIVTCEKWKFIRSQSKK